ncbi:MAG: DUF5060 domain-containing protein [Chloroflexota bacterium]
MIYKRHGMISTAVLILTILIMLGLGSSPASELSTVAAQDATAAPTQSVAPPSASTESAVSGAPTVHQPVEQYGLFETLLPVTSTVKNVFDPAQLEVTVQFTAPDHRQIAVPAFWMQPYQQSCTQDCAVEVLKPQGQPGWRVRFSPDKPGDWTYLVQERDSIAVRTTSNGKFTVTPSKRSGFIRIGKNHHYFGYDNGTPYFAVGSNLGWSWSGASGTLGYQNWLKSLHTVGANYGRLYVDVPWFIGLDWKAPVGDYTNAQDDSWRLDAILQTAEQQGIALQIVLVWSQGYSTYAGLPVNAPSSPSRPDITADWANNPYNSAVGGPLNNPGAFFSTDAGRALFKRRLRYTVARWGYSTSIFAWEMIDQLDRAITPSPDAASDWLKDTVNYLHDLDPYKHPITAGLRDSTKTSLLDRAVLDFKETRFYQRRPVEQAVDQVSGTLNVLNPLIGTADRPVMLNEFSLNPWFEPTADDPTGIHVRETMWATALSGAAGSGASWWWDTYLFPQNISPMYAPLVAFTQDVPWNTSALTPVNVSMIGDAAAQYGPFSVSGYNGTFGTGRAPDLTFRITPDGVIPPITAASSYLYGVTYGSQFIQPHKYIITPPVDTKLTVNVRRVSERGGAQLVINIDGKTAGELTLSPNSEPASLTVPISAGEHNVVVDNTGPDFLQVDSLEIAQYITPLRTVALVDKTAGIFLGWLQHRDYTWENVAKNIQIKPVTVSLRVDGMPTGQYRVELWDPFTGNVVGDEQVTVAAAAGAKTGNLAINLLPISKMIAVRAFRIADAAGVPTQAATEAATQAP